MIKASIFTFILLFFVNSIVGQEVLSGLPYNPVLTSFSPEKSFRQKSATIDELPFFDDFSNNSFLPNSANWDLENGERGVYINNSYGIGLPSIGCATFDAVNENGVFSVSASTSPFVSNELRSNPINLTKADLNTLYLSFYYQPQGEGNAPEFNDSLLLQVMGDDKVWETVWFANGTDFNSFRIDTLGIDENLTIETLDCKFEIVKLDSTKYQTEDFRFRFINYASLAGNSDPSAAINCDHWNIDYVYLNDNRNPDDSIYYDVAVLEYPALFLRNFESVPWSHYTQVQRSEISRKNFYFRNNSNSDRGVDVYLNLYENDASSTIGEIYVGQSIFKALTTEKVDWKYNSDPLFEVNNPYELNLKYEIIADIVDSVPANNIVSKVYNFTNYYAYDDGSAENAYGINGNGAQVAYQFYSYVADTLKAVNMHFLRTEPFGEGATGFQLCVWDDNNGKPGDLIYSEDTIPIFEGALNGFATYLLEQPVHVDGIFYIGWIQKSELRLNVGFDNSRNSNSYLFYNVFTGWKNSSIDGTLMIRPVLVANTLTSIKNKQTSIKQVSVYPNPARNQITINGIDNDGESVYSIYNSVGQQVLSGVTSNAGVDVSALTNGIFVIKISDNNGSVYTSRFVITK